MTSSLISKLSLHIALALALWIPAEAALTVENVAVDATNPTIFLIEAESLSPNETADRESVQGELLLQLFNPSFFAEDELEVEATFGLVKQSNGLPVPLQTTPPNTVLVISDTFTLGPRDRDIVSIYGALQPAAQLDPAINYRVSASVRIRSHGGPWSAPSVFQGTWRKWVHFFNTDTDDASLNVKAFTGPLTVTDRQILHSVAGESHFKATLGMTLHRYDLESLPQPAAEVPVTFHLRLINSATSEEVLVDPPSLTVQRSLLARSTDDPPNPVTDAWTQDFAFDVAAGQVLDPVATYQLEVTVTAEDPDTTPLSVTPSVRTAVAERYLQLSGNLWFGGVQTMFTALANDPSPPMTFNMGIYNTQIAVAEGSAPAAPGRRYGDSTPLSVSYDTVSGDLTMTGGTQTLTTNETDIVTLAGLRLVRGVIRLDFSGAQLESGGIILPAGFGVSTSQNSRRHQFALDLLGVEPLNDDFSLAFTSRVFTPPSAPHFFAFCDRLPLRFRTSAITWDVNAGTLVFTQVPSSDPADPAGPVLTRQFQDEELTARTALLADPSAATRPSNDAFLKHITDQSPITITAGPQGEAELTVLFDLGAGEMQPHFPQGTTVSWTFGRFHVDKNVVSNPSYLIANNPVTISYKRDCDGNCGTNAGPGQFVFSPVSDEWNFTADGGLTATGSLTPERLRWGTTELAGGGSPPEGGLPYAHQTNQWSEGAFHVPGSWLSGAEAPSVSTEQRPQSLLLSGVLADGSFERPLSEGYRAGLADYAGLNLRFGTPAAKTGRSVLAGISTPDYDLKGRSKYYVRQGGVTGIHEAVALIPTNLFMYGFDVTLDGFRLAFRDGLNVESKTGGSIHVDSPVAPLPGFDLDFKELSFKCRGQPHKMQLATEGETKSLAYWSTDIIPQSLEFAQPNSAGCFSVSSGFLLVGVQTRFPSVTPQKLHASLGFMANGNLVTKANPLSLGLEIDSRFTLPPNLQVVSAGDVPWEVTVVGRAYLNNPLPSAPVIPGHQQPAQGFLTFPATINVPWFEDMKVQLHVSASSTANAATSLINIMGGWPANPADGHGTGWQINGQSYFTHKFFDPDHLAFPPDIRVEDYRSPEDNAFNPRAQKRWIGVVNFDFPLVWDATLRRFRSNKQTDDLVVLGNVDRQVQSLSPSTAEITFGVELAIPRLNTQGLVAAVKEGITGAVADALTDAIGGVLKSQLGAGLENLDGLLSERLGAAIQNPIHTAVDPVADAILLGDSAASQLSVLQLNLVTLPDLGLLTEVEDRLAAGVGAIDAALAIIGSNGDRTRVGHLVRELLERSDVPGAAELGEAAVNAALAEVIPEIEPDLAQAQEVLQRVRNTLNQARPSVGNKLTTQLLAVFQETSGALNSAAALAAADIDAAITHNSWSLMDGNARRERIRRLVSDRVQACATVPRFQYVVRQHVQDTNEVFRAALDNVLGQVNHLVREVIETAIDKTVHGLTESRSSAVGEMGPREGDSGKLAGLNIEGYAQINDESLRVLDINGRFEFNIPDALLVQAHLRIEEYDANTPQAGCRPKGVTAAVVQIDARAECDWINTEPTIVEVGAKFSLQGGTPIGFDGYFALQGEITLGPIVVNEARFVAGFGGFTGPGGTHWAYVGAKIRGKFNAYEAAVGLFLGRTCDANVIRMIDPEVGNALIKSKVAGTGPVTGVYFYGEAWIPINEVYGIPSTCLFTVRAGAGAGFFAFIADTGGAFIGCKQFFGVEGELLCIFSIRGEMSILGALATAGDPPRTGSAPEDGLYQRADDPTPPEGSSFILRGAGKFSAELGVCPFCLELTKSITLTWTIGGPNAGMDIEL